MTWADFMTFPFTLLWFSNTEWDWEPPRRFNKKSKVTLPSTWDEASKQLNLVAFDTGAWAWVDIVSCVRDKSSPVGEIKSETRRHRMNNIIKNRAGNFHLVSFEHSFPFRLRTYRNLNSFVFASSWRKSFFGVFTLTRNTESEEKLKFDFLLYFPFLFRSRFKKFYFRALNNWRCRGRGNRAPLISRSELHGNLYFESQWKINEQKCWMEN